MKIELVKNNIPGVPIKIEKKMTPHDESFHVSLHLHDDIEILAGNTGVLRVTIDKKNLDVAAGDVLIIHRRVPHETQAICPNTTTMLIQFRIEKLHSSEFEKMNKYLSLILENTTEPFAFLKSDAPSTKELFETIRRLQKETMEEKREYEIFIKGYMEVLLGLLYRHGILHNIEENYNKSALQKIWPVIEYIDQNYQNKLSLEQLSATLNVNREYFCRIFKEATHITPVDYVNFVRIWKAENLLTSTDHSILEISMEVGFSSVSYFNRVFKKQKKVTPSTYRKILYAKNKLI